MKNIRYSVSNWAAIAGLFVCLVSCNDKFMDRYPLDRITDENYWKTENDLLQYANTFYPRYIVGFGQAWQDGTSQPRGHNVAATVYGDIISDNAAPNNYSLVSANQYIAYLNASSNDIGYNFTSIRELNIFIENYDKAPIDQDIKNKYLGEILFFKAWDYFDKVKNWGEVPWLDKSLQTNDPQLFEPKTPREALLDSIIMTLDQAIAFLPSKEMAANNRVHREMAIFLKSRIGLYEGTFRKYHQLPLDANRFLRIAAESALMLMDGGKYALQQGNHNTVYNQLFATESYAANPEAILWRQYSTALTYGSAFSRYFTQNSRHQFGATRSLVDEYLCADGLPISSSPLFQGKSSLTAELKNRDPRLTQTVANFGAYNLAVGVPQGAENAPKPNIPGLNGNKVPTGYRVAKWWYNSVADWDRVTNGQQAGLMWRYAEVLLTYAEAKYELGEISQLVLDKTINQLRSRVGMPKLWLGSEPIDARLDGIYQTYLGGSISPILREIRRERRVEMAFEGTRWDDIVRWKAGKLLDVPVEGIKFNQTEFPKVVVNRDIFLSPEGFIDPYRQTLPAGRKWDDRQYLFPFAMEELLLNPKLIQNPGWESPE